MVQKISADINWVLEKSVEYDNLTIKVDEIYKYDKNITSGSVLEILSYLDLTSLNDCDTQSTIKGLLFKGIRPLHSLNYRVASICIYPLYVSQCKQTLTESNESFTLTSVETSFPHGKLPLNVSLFGIKQAILDGSDEIDIVVDRGNIINQDWNKLYEEVLRKKELIDELAIIVGKKITMKTILSVGDIDNLTLIYKASLMAMFAGSDFIKTSTGKEPKITSPAHAYVMMCAIKDYFQKYEIKVGFKVAGGVKKFTDAMSYRNMLSSVLGSDWLHPSLFRIGASSLLDDIQKVWSQICDQI